MLIDAKASSDSAHRMASAIAVRAWSQPSPCFQPDRRKHRAGGVGRQQYAVGHAGIAVAEIAGKTRHLGVVGIADHEGGQAGEQRHRGQEAMGDDVADGLHDVGKAADGEAFHRQSLVAGRRPEQPEQHRQIEQRIDDDAVGGAERQHDDAAHRRAGQDVEFLEHHPNS